MISSHGSMAGYRGRVTARIAMKNSGYDNKAVHARPKRYNAPQKPVIPPSVRSLRTHTMNRVVDYRLGTNNPINMDSLLSNLI